jgi:hypothetical protein
MSLNSAVLSLGLALISASLVPTARAEEAPAKPMKEWTFLVYLNGNNNLDRFGAMNLNQMEKVGSSDQLNVVVQWASFQRKTVQRLYVQKDNDEKKVTSPVIQDMGKVDMGDYRSVIEFVRWATVNYPAKHYFIDIWDHGSGWHSLAAEKARENRGVFTPSDISWDDITGNHMTTEQLGLALNESAKLIGHKVDVYGSDACLMAMAEVAGEMADSVQIFAGSQELEPGAGWPYDTFLAAWTANPAATPTQVGQYLTSTYVKSYQGGTNGNEEVTFSAYDMDKYPALVAAVSGLSANLAVLGAADRSSVMKAADQAIYFYYSDYVDLGDFMRNLESARTAVASDVLTQAKAAMQDFVIANGVTSSYAKASGLSIWLPGSQSLYNTHSARYQGLQFAKQTHWGDTLAALLK